LTRVNPLFELNFQKCFSPNHRGSNCESLTPDSWIGSSLAWQSTALVMGQGWGTTSQLLGWGKHYGQVALTQDPGFFIVEFAHIHV